MAPRTYWLTLATTALVVLTACAPAASQPTSAPATAAKPAAEPAAAPAKPAEKPAQAKAEAKAPSGSDKLNAVVEAARKEGELAFTASSSVAGTNELLERMFAQFNKRYDLNARFRFNPVSNEPQTNARIIEEHKAGRPASDDVATGADGDFLALTQAGALAEVDWLEWAPNIRKPEIFLREGRVVKLYGRAPGITYMADRIRDVPQSMEDLLKPQYKGRIASTTYATGFDRLATQEMWGKERTLAYLTKFANQVSGLVGCGDLGRLTSGEFDMMAIDCGNHVAYQIKKQGAQGGHVIPSDGAHITYQYMGVTKDAKHPNIAKLFVDFALSREAQDIFYEGRSQDLQILDGSKIAADFKKYGDAGMKFVEFDVDIFARTPDSQATKTELVRILAKR